MIARFGGRRLQLKSLSDREAEPWEEVGVGAADSMKVRDNPSVSEKVYIFRRGSSDDLAKENQLARIMQEI